MQILWHETGIICEKISNLCQAKMTYTFRSCTVNLLAKDDPIVVYFDHPMGAPHTVHWSKSIFWRQKTFCVLLNHNMYKIWRIIFGK